MNYVKFSTHVKSKRLVEELVWGSANIKTDHQISTGVPHQVMPATDLPIDNLKFTYRLSEYFQDQIKGDTKKPLFIPRRRTNA